MADYPISNVARRIVYTGSAGVGPYAFNFEVLANTDIKVYKNDVLLTLTTDYSVTISPTLGTGSITLVSAATGADRITIVGARAIQRTTDFTTGGDFFANTLNDEMDSQTILVQQVAETADRGIKAPVTDPTSINMTLPINTARAGKTLAFDTNGNPIAGDSIGNWRGNWAAGVSYQSRDLVKESTTSNVYIVLTAHISSGSLPISTNVDSAKWELVFDATNIPGNLTFAGNLNFTGTANRITGDFTNATTDSRVSFQTSTANGGTFVDAIPKGTSTLSSFTVFNNSVTTNSSWGALNQVGTATQIVASKNGTGTYGNLEFWTSGLKQGYFSAGGGFATAGSLQVAEGVGSSDSAIEIGGNRTADGNAYIDLRAALTSAGGTGDYDLRIIRNAGTNGSAQIINLGTGGIYFSNNNIISLYIDQAHNSQFPIGAIMPYAPTPTSISAATTLTNANIQAQIINTTGTTYTVTLPTGSTLETIANWVAFNIGYDFWIINTASGTITIGANGNSTLGSLTVAAGVSAQFRLRRTALNTFTVYRLG